MTSREVRAGNLRAGLPSQPLPGEVAEVPAKGGRARIERIVSTGQSTPPGEWYDEENEEWVLLFSGQARLRIETEIQDRELRPGDWLLLPAHSRHRVTWTSTEPPAIWLAVHIAPE